MVPSNEVLSEQIKQLRKDFYSHKNDTQKYIRQLEDELNETKEKTNTININMSYVRDTVSDMKAMMSEFVKVQNEQSQKIDNFVNSDKRMSDKRKLITSILQVVSGIVIAILGMWGAGQF